MLALFFSLIAGALSTLSPCVLPIVPIMMSSAMQTARFGPLALLSGLVMSYTIVGTVLALFGTSTGLHAEQLRIVSAWLMLIFGSFFLIPALQRLLIRLLSPLSSRASSSMATFKADSVLGQAILGLMLGIVWSPCVGPTLGAAVTLAANAKTALQAMLTMFVFGIGAALPMALLAYGSRSAMGGKRKEMMQVGLWGKRIMGVALLMIGVLVLTGSDRWLEVQLTSMMPAWLIDLTTRF
jgi:cytochrome c-type biogenesis protein